MTDLDEAKIHGLANHYAQQFSRHSDRQLLFTMFATITIQNQRMQEMVFMAATKQDLDNALDSLKAAEAQRDAAVIVALQDFLNKNSAGTITTPEDYSAEIIKIQTLVANAANITAQATAADLGPTVLSATPAPVATTVAAASSTAIPATTTLPDPPAVADPAAAVAEQTEASK